MLLALSPSIVMAIVTLATLSFGIGWALLAGYLAVEKKKRIK